MMSIPYADLKGANHAFFTSINFGDISHGTQYTAATPPDHTTGGSGTVTVAPHGHDATVTFDVTSSDSVSYTGTIQCTSVSGY